LNKTVTKDRSAPMVGNSDKGGPSAPGKPAAGPSKVPIGIAKQPPRR